MATFKHSVHIKAPVEKVFAFFSDPRNWQDLVADGVTIADVDRRPEGVGTRYRWLSRVAGFRIAGANVFTEFVPNRRITDESSSWLEGTWTYTFEPHGEGTMVTIENIPVSFWRLPVLDRISAHLAGGHRQVMLALKARMENEPV